MESNTVFNKDFDAASVFVMKVYDADVSIIWNHFTKPELLDQWWAPKPWRCETSNLDFRENTVETYLSRLEKLQNSTLVDARLFRGSLEAFFTIFGTCVRVVEW